jgi:glycerophosphoryl diester phosphodiesterase
MLRPLLRLGHRGARATAAVPENTLASFDLALQHGCDGFEFDVRMKTCGRAVICHDPEVDGIEVATAACDQLTHLPELGAVMERYAKRAFLNIELKVPGLESQVLVALEEHVPQRGYVVSSFVPEVLSELRVRSSSMVLGLICDKQKDLNRWRQMPVEFVIPHYSLITRELINQIHAADRNLLTWTVNDKAAILRLRDWGLDGIISDDTELLVNTLATGESSGSQSAGK